jgi:hypothetical protein
MSSGSSGSRVAYPAPVFASICDFTSLIVAVVYLLARLRGGMSAGSISEAAWDREGNVVVASRKLSTRAMTHPWLNLSRGAPPLR